VLTVWESIAREIEDFTARIRTLPVLRLVPPRAVREEVESTFDLAAPVPLDDLTRKVAALFRAHSVQVTHPRYFGLFNPSVSEAGIVGDTLAAVYNAQLATWSHSPAANELERLTLRHLTRRLGLDPDSTIANFTSGGLEANMSAVLAALAHRFPLFAEDGASAIGARPVIYVTSESHHSFLKIARMIGLGAKAVCEATTTSGFAFDVTALRERIHDDMARGRCALMIVGTAGTTGGGIVDPLPALADIARESNAWFHVDAAWGGAAVMAPRLRPALAGIERADSVTWDAHKWMSAPMGAGMFFCRHAEAVHRAFDAAASYMPSDAGAETVDAYNTTVQWSRRAIGLKVFMSLAERGEDAFARQIDHHAHMGDRLRSKLAAAGWIVVNETVLPVICFTHDDIRSGRVSTGRILNTIYTRGNVWISDVVLGRQERVLRACITSFRTEDEDLDYLIEELDLARRLDKASLAQGPSHV
jgi:glutamate/tyrosine decarboxylase-like PLP-dependent enzyme